MNMRAEAQKEDQRECLLKPFRRLNPDGISLPPIPNISPVYNCQYSTLRNIVLYAILSYMKENTSSSAHAQMRKGMLEFCTMLIIEKGEAYASDILKKLKTANLIVVEGTLYPLLSRLRAQELLDYSWEESKSGPPRKYYSLTSDGKKELKDMKGIWEELAQSINSLLK